MLIDIVPNPYHRTQWLWVIHPKREVLMTDDPGLVMNGNFAGQIERPEADDEARRLARKYGYRVHFNSTFWDVDFYEEDQS